MPRGCEDAILSFLTNNNVEFHVTDETNHGKRISVFFKGEEREDQIAAINALLPHSNGILHATTAFGKTVTAAAIIARKKTNTLILVHSKTLLTQWHERLTEFLDVEYQEPVQTKKRSRKSFSPIGCLDSTGNSLHGIIDIALIQSCLDEDGVKPFVQDYGMVIVDECHHVSSVTFENVLKGIKANIVYGLTATPIRKDGHQPIIFMQCGPIRFSADAKSQIAVEQNSLVNQLCELVHNGCNVLILTTIINEQTEHLQSRGLPIKIVPNLSLCTTIIDKTIVWYGAINTLGFASDEDNVIKVTDNNLADELIEALVLP